MNATNTLPTVDNVLAPDVIFPNLGDTAYSFFVEYSDVGGVNASLDRRQRRDCQPLPREFSAVTGLIGTTSDPNGTSVTATYSFTPPDGDWAAADVGLYTINLVAGQVLDVAGASVVPPAPNLATFEVLPDKLLNESFEAAGPGYDTAFHDAGITIDDGTPFNAAGGDWNRTDGTDIVNTTAPFSNPDGTYFWVGDGLLQGGAATGGETFAFSGIDISDHIDLSFSGYLLPTGKVHPIAGIRATS